MDELEQRIIALEEKYSHQDHLVSELNKMVPKQEQTIEELVNYIQLIKDDKGSSNSVQNLEDEVPPHY